MSAPGRGSPRVWSGTLVVWAALLAGLGVNVALVAAPLGPAKTAAHLAVAGAMVLALALTFMKLDRASGLVRLTAAAGVLWACFLFLLAGADVLARS